MVDIVKKKGSELPVETTLAGFNAIGINASNQSVQVPLSLVQDASNAANAAAGAANNAATAATTAAGTANTAAGNADTKAGLADTAATAANNAASAATTAAGSANTATTAANNAATAANEAAVAANEAVVELVEYVENGTVYGVEFDTSISSPTCTRIGNLNIHRSLPIQSRMKGCLLSDSGEVVEYLNPTNWRAHDLTGASGQVMIEIPEHWRKFETEGTKRRVYICEFERPGFHFVPKSYISAYEATIERSTGKLCSVVNLVADFRGGANQAEWDATYRTVIGRPVTVKSRGEFRAAARLRNASATSAWNCSVYEQYKTVFWLFVIEYATLNSQLPYNAAKDVSGYAQGGLGNGVIDMLDWAGYNGYYPFVPCGHSDSLCNASGEVAYAVKNEDDSTRCTVYVNRYRGIENPFGHIWKWTDGINVDVKIDGDGGTSKVYVATNPANFNDSNYTGFEMRGLEARAEGYVTAIIFGEFGDMMPLTVGGGSTTYFCDYHYTNVGSSILSGVLFGGGAVYGGGAGFACAGSFSAPSDANATFGSRLCFLPV